MVLLAAGIEIYVLLITVLITVGSTAGELRPSDHGLEYHNSSSPENEPSPEMRSFFGSSSSSSSSTSPPDVALPRAMNSSNDSWWKGTHTSSSNGSDHARYVLMVASLVCGITGAVLLVSAGLVYFISFQRRKSSSSCNNK